MASHGESLAHFALSSWLWGSWISKIISHVGLKCSSAPQQILHPCTLIDIPLLPLHQWRTLWKLAIVDAGFGVLCNEAAGTFRREVLSFQYFLASCHYHPSLCQCQVLFFYGHWLMHANKFLYRQGLCQSGNLHCKLFQKSWEAHSQDPSRVQGRESFKTIIRTPQGTHPESEVIWNHATFLLCSEI